jgi:hypothetical protein
MTTLLFHVNFCRQIQRSMVHNLITENHFDFYTNCEYI